MARQTLRELRENAGFSVRGLAKETGFSTGSIYYWESGQQIPRSDHLRRLAELYGVSMDDIALPGEDDPGTKKEGASLR